MNSERPVKELNPIHADVNCDACGRTMLKGERVESYLAPGGHRKVVCEVCMPRAERSGWIRECQDPDTPVPRWRDRGRRRPLAGRLLGRFRRHPHAAADDTDERVAAFSTASDTTGTGEAAARALPAEDSASPDSGPATGDVSDGPIDPSEDRRRREVRPARKADPFEAESRNVHAVPTTAEVKVQRALEMFNASDHAYTIAGISRTLGTPSAGVRPSADAAGEVAITIGWELSWYQYVVDLADPDEPVRIQSKGDELSELPDDAKRWNAECTADGSIKIRS